jgi:hypothetical protein
MSEPFKTTAVQESVCARCKAVVWQCFAGGFDVKLDRVLLSKFEELQIHLEGGSTFRLVITMKETTAKLRLLRDLQNGINGPQPLVLSLHECKEESLVNAQLPF